LFCNTNPEPLNPLTVPPIENFDEQVILTLVTLAAAVPDPFVTLHICVGFVGCVCTVTLYKPPKVNAVLNVKGTVPVPVTVKASPLLSSSTNPVPARPVTVPPTVTVAVVQVTCTDVTFAVAVPDPFATVHVSDGLLGCVPTVTAYAPPLAKAVLNVKAVEPAATVSESLPLSTKTSPVPVRPVIVPPIVNVVVPPPPPPPPPVPFTPLHAAITMASKAIRRNDNFLLGIIGVLFFSFFILGISIFRGIFSP
jgi:hypothetical protein